MKNTNHNHSESYIYSRQSDAGLEQQISTPGLVYMASRTNAVPPAGLPCSLPLVVERFDNSREPARQPAQPKAVWPNQSTHTRRVRRGLEQGTESHIFSRTRVSRPNTQAYSPTSGHPYTGEAHLQRDNPQTSERYPERPRRGVWQDKAHLESVPPGTGQPAPVTKVTLSQFTNNHVVRSHNVSGITQKSGRISFWADPALKERLRAVALREGLSISATCAAFLRKSLQQDIDLEYSATLEPVFERLIGKFMRGISTRLAWLLVRVSIDSGQTRSLVTNILGRQQGMTTDLLRSIVKQSADTARGNITRRTPQLEDVIESVEKWLLTDDPPDNKDRGGDN